MNSPIACYHCYDPAMSFRIQYVQRVRDKSKTRQLLDFFFTFISRFHLKYTTRFLAVMFNWLWAVIVEMVVLAFSRLSLADAFGRTRVWLFFDFSVFVPKSGEGRSGKVHLLPCRILILRRWQVVRLRTTHKHRQNARFNRSAWKIVSIFLLFYRFPLSFMHGVPFWQNLCSRVYYDRRRHSLGKNAGGSVPRAIDHILTRHPIDAAKRVCY